MPPVLALAAALALDEQPGPCAESLLWSCLTTVPLASVTVASAVADDEQTPAACGTLGCPALAVAEALAAAPLGVGPLLPAVGEPLVVEPAASAGDALF